jgi:hypothetical protein
LTYGHCALATVCEDVSVGGMFVLVPQEGPVEGQLVRVRLALPSDGAHVLLEGIVIRTGPPGTRAGIGARLRATDALGQRRWGTFLDEIAESSAVSSNAHDVMDEPVRRLRPFVEVCPQTPARLREFYLSNLLGGCVWVAVNDLQGLEDQSPPIPGTALHVRVIHPSDGSTFVLDALAAECFVDDAGKANLRLMLVRTAEAARGAFLRFIRDPGTEARDAPIP